MSTPPGYTGRALQGPDHRADVLETVPLEPGREVGEDLLVDARVDEVGGADLDRETSGDQELESVVHGAHRSSRPASPTPIEQIR
jgi:hypothetical protein